MKILHISYLRNLAPHSGIVNQLRYERLAAESLGLHFQNLVFSKNGVLDLENLANSESGHRSDTPNPLLWIKERMAFASFLQEISASCDVIMLRWSMADPFAARAIRKLSKPVFTVHHTNEEAELSSSARLGNLRARLDRALFRQVSSSLSGVIAVTPEIGEFERARARKDLPVIPYPNGIIFDERKVPGTIGDSRMPRLVFVASHFSTWHGLDLLLESVRSSSERFELHIVGNVSEAQKSSFRDIRQVVFWGPLFSDDLYKLYESCDIGLSSFGMERRSLKQAATLKVREYLNAGIPIYAGYDDIFPENFKFYRKGPPQIEEILRYANELRGIQRQTVRESAREFIDKSVLLQGLNDEVVSIVSQGDRYT